MRILVPPTLNVSSTVSMPALDTVPAEIQVPIGEARHLQLAYIRKFAGKARATRDGRLLQEMGERLRGLHAEILSARLTEPSVKRALAVIANHVALFAVEVRQIQAAFQSGAIRSRLIWTVDCLNEQLIMYQRHFASLPRLSRRLGLARRSLASLTDILKMVDDSLFLMPGNDRLALCKQRGQAQVSVIEREIVDIERVQAATSLTERLQALYLDVELIHADFKASFEGRPRADASLEALGHLCDRLHEDELQMAAVSRGERYAVAGAGELPKVQRLLDVYEAEYQRILTARQLHRI